MSDANLEFNSPTFTEESDKDGTLVSTIHVGQLVVQGFPHEIRVPSEGSITIGCKTHDERWWRKFGLGVGVANGIDEEIVDEMKIAFDILCKARPKIRAVEAKLAKWIVEIDEEMAEIAEAVQTELKKKIGPAAG